MDRLSRYGCFLVMILFTWSCMAFDKITVVGLFKDKAVVRIDNKQRVLKKGVTSPEGITLISANSNEAVLEINGEQQSYTLGTHVSINFKPPEKGPVVTIAPSNGMYHVNGSINDFQVSFLVDTGASSITMNRYQAKRIGLNYKMDGRETISETASGITKVYVVNLDSVRVGDIELNDVQGIVHDSEFPRVILLGSSFLNRVKMNRDGQLLLLEK